MTNSEQGSCLPVDKLLNHLSCVMTTGEESGGL